MIRVIAIYFFVFIFLFLFYGSVAIFSKYYFGIIKKIWSVKRGSSSNNKINKALLATLTQNFRDLRERAKKVGSVGLQKTCFFFNLQLFCAKLHKNKDAEKEKIKV